MKYFKITQISAETGVSWAIAQPISGPSFPIIPGLEISTSIQLSHSPLYYLAKVDDSAVANPDNHVFELTSQEYAEELKNHILHILNEEKNSIYKEEFNFRQAVFNKYHESASIAGVYKYNQAKELVADETAAAPDVRAEATARGVTPVVMANRIIQNHENFRQKEAKIAGIRGKILDRIESFTFDMQDPDASYNDFKTEEIVGTIKQTVREDGNLVEKDVDIKVGKYKLSLETRFNYE